MKQVGRKQFYRQILFFNENAREGKYYLKLAYLLFSYFKMNIIQKRQIIHIFIMVLGQYLRTGDFITISHEGLFLVIQSLTQSTPYMKESISNPINAVFLLTTQKCLEKSIDEKKPLTSYKEDDIYYSEPVLLYHLLSGKFLSYSVDIENNSSIQLITSFKQNCKFTIKPIFKCQTVVTRKIKNNESIVITPSEAYNHEGNISMLVVRNQNRKGDESYVLMKKNETSKFEFCRKNQHSVPNTSISNIYVYQLQNIETKKNLYMTESENKNKDYITFQKSINQFASFFSFRLKGSQYNTINVIQKQINYGVPFYIHSWKQNKYLSINMIGDACLTEVPHEQAEFIAQSYSDNHLNKESVVRIRHISTKKYLSINSQSSQIQMINDARLIDTYIIYQVPIEQLRLNVFINDAHEIIQRELSGKKITYNNKDNISKVLKQLINFIFGDSITMADFLSMKNKISCRLSSSDQRLLANIGIINTLVRMCRIFIEQITKQSQSKQFEQKDKSQEQAIIIYTMMSIVGICNRNTASTKIFVQQMPLLYESIVSVGGIIESFYNLFKDSKELLLILENTSHKVGRKQIPSLQLLINMLSGQKLDIPTKNKILKLLQIFIIVNHKQKILGHEAILLKSLMENKLQNIMLPMKSNDHEDMMFFIPQKKSYEQLEQLLNSRKNYEKQLQLAKTQLQLICSLCLNSSSQCFAYANKILSEQMVYRYLKANLQSDFKEVFMKMLIDIHLSHLAARNYSKPKCFVLCRDKNDKQKRQYSQVEYTARDQLLQNEMEMEEVYIGPSHSKVVQNIQNYILEVTKKSIVNEIIDSSFYMNLKSLRKFLELRILDKDQVVEFRLLLIQYITKFSRQSFKEEQKKKIVLQILKIMTDYLNQFIEHVTQQFIFILKEQQVPKQRLYDRFITFSNQFGFFKSELQNEELKFLPQLIKDSIQFNNVQIFVAASNLLKLVNQRASIFIGNLKQKIIIQSQWSNTFYNRVYKVKRQINNQIQAYMNAKSDPKKVQFIFQQLNQLIKQLNYWYFQSSNTSSTSFSQLTQNVYRQMNLLQSIINFLNDSQDKFKQTNSSIVDIYQTCFQFLGMYLQNNKLNFNRFYDKYIDIKFVFQYPDRGQIKFLNKLIKTSYARNLLIDEIIDCISLSFQRNSDPNPYTLLALLNSINDFNVQKQRIESFVERLMREPQIFKNIMKISESSNGYSFDWSFDSTKKNYHKDWLLYLFLLFKFLLTLLEQSSQRTSLTLQIQKYININTLIQLLRVPDLLASTSITNLQGSLLKIQVIRLFTKIYIPILEKQKQTQRFSTFVYSTFQNFNHVRDQIGGNFSQLMDQVMQQTSDHGIIIYESQINGKSNAKLIQKQFQKYFKPAYVNIVEYYPFMLKVLDTFINANSYIDSDPQKKSQLILTVDNSYRRLKDFLQHKFTARMFNQYSREYQTAISNCEDLFKKRLGFTMKAQDQEDDEDVGQIEVTQYFINSKIQNTIKCYRYSSSMKEKKIYQSFIYIFHCEKFRDFLRKDQQNLSITVTIDEFQKIIQMLFINVSQKRQNFTKNIEIFSFFTKFNTKHCLSMNFLGTREMIMDILSNQKEDVGNHQICSYVALTLRFFKLQVHKEKHILKKQQGYIPFSKDFLTRLKKKIQHEKLLYSNYKVNEQALIYSDNGILTYQTLQSNFTIELCLQWIKNLAIITSLQNKQQYYYSLFMQVVDLLKTYNNFIKQFNSKYISFEIYNKINECLQIIFHFISGITDKNMFINYLIERQIWNDLNFILGLDDGWNRNIDEIQDNQYQIFAKVIRNQLRSKSQYFLKQAQKYYQNSKKKLNDIIPQSYYPLLPKKALFGEIKSNVISIIKQFKHFPKQILKQFFSRIEMPIINRNISEVYKKHNRLFNEYGIPSVEIDVDYDRSSQWRQIAQNTNIQNGVDLTSIKMYIGSISGNNDLKAQFDNVRLQAVTSKKIRSAFISFFVFIRDFFLIFISCFLSLCRKSKTTEKKQEQQIDQKQLLPILRFFMTKIGRVEVINDSQLLLVDFIVRPECLIKKSQKRKFISNINFISMQLKLQSVNSQATQLLLTFQNQIDFYRVFNKIAFITFLTRNYQMITYLNFLVIVSQNIVLIANSNSKDEYFVTNSLDQPFVWLQIMSTILAGFTMVAYCVKDFRLLLMTINMKLKIRAESYGSNFNNYGFFMKLGIKISMIILDPTFIYNVIYTLIVCLVFYNKLFAALLLLDIFLKIPTLKNLLLSVWRPKIQIILALISFVLVQYFFSIFMFFNFKKDTLGYCNTLASCFGFVFVTTYKAVGGFVGFLFIKNGSQIQTVTFFQIFQDMYVILIFQIFFALILAIIIDTFSVIRNEQSSRKDYLDSCCIVCNLDKTNFNSSTMSFRAHIAITHHIWNYFYYYEYIFHKPAVKRTSYEREIFLSKSANWLPIDKSFDVTETKMVKKQTQYKGIGIKAQNK